MSFIPASRAFLKRLTRKLPKIKHHFHWARARKDEGMLLPSRLIGYSWRDFDMDVTHYYIFPVNITIALWHWVRRFFLHEIAWKLQYKEEHHQYQIKQAFKKGYKMGRFNLDVAKGYVEEMAKYGIVVDVRTDPFGEPL